MGEISKKRRIFKTCYIVCYLVLILVASVLFRTAWPLPIEFFEGLPTYIILLVLVVAFCVRLFVSARKGKLLGVPKTKNKIYLLLGVLLNTILRSLIVAVPLWGVGVIISICQTGGADSMINGFWAGVFFVGYFIVITAFIFFIILNVLYLVAYFIMPKKQEEIEL